MDNKLVIWFIGANASGKTTQAALLHKYFRDLFGGNEAFINEYVEEDVDGVPVKYTLLSSVTANVGRFNHPITAILETNTTATCGTGTINKKEQIQKSFEEALKRVPIVVVEGVMATGTWIDFLKRKDVYLVLIHMNMPLDETLARLIQRRAAKTGKSENELVEELKEKTIKNIDGKVRGFESMFNRLKDEADFAFSVDATKKMEWIHYEIVKKIKQIL